MAKVADLISDMAIFKDYIGDVSGATAIEYGLIVALFAIATIVGGKALGDSLNNRFTDVGDTVTDAGIAEGAIPGP